MRGVECYKEEKRENRRWESRGLAGVGVGSLARRVAMDTSGCMTQEG